MNLYASISFTVVFLLQAITPNMDICCEFSKLPNLFKHYSLHYQVEKESFLQFLVEDYLSDDTDHQHHGNSGHDDLPFSGNHQCNHATTVFISQQFENLSIFEHYESSKFGAYLSQASESHVEIPFQPPKG